MKREELTASVGMIIAVICIFGVLGGMSLVTHNNAEPEVRAALYPWMRALGTVLAICGVVMGGIIAFRYFPGRKVGPYDWVVTMFKESEKVAASVDKKLTLLPFDVPFLVGFFYDGCLYFGDDRDKTCWKLSSSDKEYLIESIDVEVMRGVLMLYEEDKRKRDEAKKAERAELLDKLISGLMGSFKRQADLDDPYPKDWCNCVKCQEARDAAAGTSATPDNEISAKSEAPCGDKSCNVCAPPEAAV